MRSKRLNRKGFTLVELIAAMAIMTIFSVCIAMVFGPTMGHFARTIELNDASVIATTVADEVRGALTYAYNVDILNDHTFTVWVYGNPAGSTYSVVDGYLCRDDIPVYDPLYYKGNACDMVIEDLGDGLFGVQLILAKTQNTQHTYTKTFYIRPLGLS